jgi:hypothetical protein
VSTQLTSINLPFNPQKQIEAELRRLIEEAVLLIDHFFYELEERKDGIDYNCRGTEYVDKNASILPFFKLYETDLPRLDEGPWEDISSDIPEVMLTSATTGVLVALGIDDSLGAGGRVVGQLEDILEAMTANGSRYIGWTSLTRACRFSVK